jgi:SAM-dependent methyltransferase
MPSSIIKKIGKFFVSSKNKILVAMIIMIVILFILQSVRGNAKYEGFQQKEPFVTERNSKAYDGFYAEIYDRLYKTESRSEKDALNVIKATQPDKEHSTFLDVGCGTGCLVDALKRQGYNAVGVDYSEAMIEVGKERRPKTCGGASLKKGDALDSLLFDRGVFSHILCLERTIYEMEDKIAFLRNCKHWLIPGGYLLLHLVEPDKYNAIVPLGKPDGLDSVPMRKTDGTRITDTAIDFVDFKYKSSYDFSELKRGVVTQTETFTDSASSRVRQNEHTFFMTDSKSIVDDARYCGFVLMGESVAENDPHQKVFILKSL